MSWGKPHPNYIPTEDLTNSMLIKHRTIISSGILMVQNEATKSWVRPLYQTASKTMKQNSLEIFICFHT